MLLRVVFEGLRRRWKARIVGLLTVAFGVAVLGALLHLVTQGEDELALDLRAYGPNLVVRPGNDAPGAALDVASVPAVRTIFWRNNVRALSPVLEATGEASGARFELEGAWLDRPLPKAAGDDSPEWRTGMRYLEPSWSEPGIVAGRLPRDESPTGDAEALVGSRLAAARGWKPGDVVEVARGEHAVRLAITGILRSGDRREDVVVAPIEAVQRLLDRPGAASHVLVGVLAKPDDELSRKGMASLSDADKERMVCSPYLGTVAHQIQEAVPGAVAEPIRRVSEAESAYRSRVQALLGLLAAAAALLTCLGVYGSVRSSLGERRAEMGLLRALGAPNGTLSALFLGEGVALGLFGALAGVLIGFAMASALSRAVLGRALDFAPASLPLLVGAGVILSALGAGLAVRHALRADSSSLLGRAP